MNNLSFSSKSRQKDDGRREMYWVKLSIRAPAFGKYFFVTTFDKKFKYCEYDYQKKQFTIPETVIAWMQEPTLFSEN